MVEITIENDKAIFEVQGWEACNSAILETAAVPQHLLI